MNTSTSPFSTLTIISTLVLCTAGHGEASEQNISYFDGKKTQTMSVTAVNFAPTHPDACSEKKKAAAVETAAAIPSPIAEGDADSDGVIDSKDTCPNTPNGYKVDTQGCPKSVTLHMNFAFASSAIPTSSDNDVSDLIQFMNDNPASSITIIGHTDSIGADVRNQPLSQARANALAEKLTDAGIDKNRIKTSGKGSHEPVATNDTDEGRAQNRRIEIEIR